MEKWEDIKGFEHYQISNLGRVKSKKRDIIMSLGIVAGYFSISLCKENVKTRHYVHRLIAVAFIPNPLKKETVNHINGIKTDNRIENLEWATRSEQNLHASKLGLKKFNGEDHSQNKLTNNLVLEIRGKASIGESTKGLFYGVSDATIRDIVTRKSWKHI